MSRIRRLFGTTEIDPEARNRVLLIGGVALVVAVALSLIAFGYYIDRIAPNNDTVFTAGDRKFSYSYLVDRIDAAVADKKFDTSNMAYSLGLIVSDLQNEELTRLIAKEEGLSVTPAELDAAMREDVRVSPGAPQNTFAAGMRSRLTFLGLSLDRYEEMIAAQVLEQKIKAQIRDHCPCRVGRGGA